MHASRIRLLSASSSSGTANAFSIPPRTSWDILKSAANASWTILWSQEKRDLFVETLNKGVIRPDVLSQADHGAAMVLALFHDLQSPLFKKYEFNAQEFSDGVKPALEQFHNVLGNLENTLYEENNTESSDEKENEKESKEEKESSSQEESVEQALKSLGAHPAMNSSMSELAQLLRVQDKSTEIQQVLKKNWVEDADDKPESLAAQLMAMVTPQYFTAIQDIARTKWLLGRDKWLYEDGTSEINNVALLSARARLMPDENASEEGESNDTASVKDEELDVKEEDYFSQDSRVAAQVEVLYDIKQTYRIIGKPSESNKENADTIEASDENKEDTSSDSDDNTVAKPNVWVGVFEGWLNGNPDGTSDLQWKLVLNRQAWEFPSLSNSYYP